MGQPLSTSPFLNVLRASFTGVSVALVALFLSVLDEQLVRASMRFSNRQPPLLSGQKKKPKSAVKSKNSQLAQLHEDYIKASREYRVSLSQLLALYERGWEEATSHLAHAKDLFKQGLIGKSELDFSETAVVDSRRKVDEVRNQIAIVDAQLGDALVVLPYDDGPSVSSATCSDDAFVKLSIRGLRLGMNQRIVADTIPTLRFGAADAYGITRAILYSSKPGSALAQTGQLKDVWGVQLEFLDRRLTSIVILYDNSVKWRDSDEFVSRVSQALGLKNEWHYLPGRPELSLIRCGTLSLVAGLVSNSGNSSPLLKFTDARADSAVNQRILSRAAKKQQAQEEKRRAFKP